MSSATAENVCTESETVVAGPKYLPELSKLPDSFLSNIDAIEEVSEYPRKVFALRTPNIPTSNWR